MTLFLVAYFLWSVYALLFSGVWLIQKKTKNAGIVDVVWTYATGAAGIVLILYAAAPLFRKVIVGAIVLTWTLRLGLHLTIRYLNEPEDGRYTEMRKRWGDKYEKKMYFFYQLQAAWAVLFALPMLSAAMNPAESLGWFDIAGIAVFLLSVVGEGIADVQLFRFKQNADNRGKVCRVGLWGYSRHPNYFFEWLHWFAYVFISFGSIWMIGSLAGVAVMYLFLTRVTGIPLTEKRISASRKEAYAVYQQEVSSFFPLPNRTSKQAVQ